MKKILFLLLLTNCLLLHGADFGIDGHYKTGCWIPVSSNENIVSITAPDADGIDCQFIFDSQGKSGVYFKTGRSEATVLINEKRIVLPAAVPNERPIFLVIGEESIGFSDAISLLRLKENKRPVIVRVPSWDSLPKSWIGYDAVDYVILNTALPTFFDGVEKGDLRITALEDWVKNGGHLLFNPGKDSEPFLTEENGIFARFAPGKLENMRTLRQSLALETFSGSERSILMDGSDVAPFLRVPIFRSENKNVVALSEGDVPLLIRSAHGFGTITTFAADLAGAPLQNWRDRGLLLFRVLQLPESKIQSATQLASLTHLGFNDLSGQIRSSLDKYEGVYVAPFSVILIAMTLFVFLISYIDWQLAIKIAKRPIVTYLTFPLFLIAFAAGAWLLADWQRPSNFVCNQLDVVDYSFESNQIRNSSWISLYSPTDAKYEISGEDGTLLSWLGLSGSGFGSMSPKNISPTVWTQPYFLENKSILKNVPLQIRSSKSFFAQNNFIPENKIDAGTLIEKEGIPSGEIRNIFGADLKNCLIVYGRWVIEIGDIPADGSAKVGTQNPRRELNFLISAPHLEFDMSKVNREGERRINTYSVSSQDLPFIVRAMTFYNAVGGFDAVGLNNSFQSWMDLSKLLSANQAVLIGEMADTPSGHKIGINGDETFLGNRKIIMRAVFPIE